MPKFYLILIILCAPLHATERVVTSPPIPIQWEISEAKTAWAAVPNKADPLFLDHFIATYPQSNEAQVAFTLRFNGVQTSRSIPHYQAFIDKYASTLAAKQAIYELFELYHQQNTLTGYFEFIQRYPNSFPAKLAQLHLEALLFEKYSQLDSIRHYDNFIALFPTAAQVFTVMQLAQNKALAIEKKALTTELAHLKSRLSKQQQMRTTQFKQCLHKTEHFKDCLNKLNEIEQTIADLKEELEKIVEKRANTLATQMEQVATMAKKADESKKFYYNRLVKRYCYVLLNVYIDRTAPKRCRVEQRHEKTLTILQQMIANGNRVLIETLKAEFAKTHQVLRDGFKRLHLDHLAETEIFKALNKVFNQIPQDFITINRNLIKIHQEELSDIQMKMAKTNANLRLLHKDMKVLHNHLVQLNRDMNQGMAKQRSLLRNAAGIVKQGFSILHADLEASELSATKLKQEQLALPNRQRFSEQQTTKIIDKTHQQPVLRQNLGNLIEAQRWTVKAIEHQTDVMIYNTDRLLVAEQHTRQSMSQFLRQFIDAIKPGQGCGDKDIDEIVSDAWGDANFYPACQKHDQCYETCGKTKGYCDDAFHDDLKNECRSLDVGETPCLTVAKSYYLGVSKGGNTAWKEAQEYCLSPIQ